MERWKNGRFKRTIKELSQFDNKKQEELESEFEHFDVDNSYPTSPIKACKTTLSLTQYQIERLIGLTRILYLSLQNCSTVTPGFLLGIFFGGGGQNLLLCKLLSLFYCFRTKFQGGAKVSKGGQTVSGGRPCPPVGESQQRWSKQASTMLILSVQQISIRISCCNITCESG